MLYKERGLVDWDPGSRFNPDIAFLFLTSAPEKAKGLDQVWKLKSRFGNWSPSKSPVESNHLSLRGLIRQKARDLTNESVRELRTYYFMDEYLIPSLFLVTDTHPSLSVPGYTGEVHLVKPEPGLNFDEIVEFVSNKWSRFHGAVDVQIASAFAMTNRRGQILTSQPIQDSVFISYPDNPLKDKNMIRDYLGFLWQTRFSGLREAEFIQEISKVAGVIYNELLYPFAYARGIEGTISHALSNPCEANLDSIVAMGAAGLTPAIVGWIEQRVNKGT